MRDVLMSESITPQNEPLEPQNEPLEPTKRGIEYDDELIDNIVNKAYEKLEKKTYQGRKYEKKLEKDRSKLEKLESALQKEDRKSYILVALLGILSAGFIVFGFLQLKKENASENNS